MYEVDLKPCPCCGGSVVMSDSSNDSSHTVKIKCVGCGLKLQRTTRNVPYGVHGCVRHAALAWNTRKERAHDHVY